MGSTPPLYEKFIKATSDHPMFKKPITSYKENKALEETAKEILDDILKEH